VRSKCQPLTLTGLAAVCFTLLCIAVSSSITGCEGESGAPHIVAKPAFSPTAESPPHRRQGVSEETYEKLVVITETKLPGMERDGKGTSAHFNEPAVLSLAPDGMLYVLDEGSGAIRKVTRDGLVTTVTTSPDFKRNDLSEFPSGLAANREGDLFVSVAARNVIWKVTPKGATSLYAGTRGIAGHKDGPAASALFSAPSGLAVDRNDALYVADASNNAIRKIAADGTVTTPIGGRAGFADGPIRSARFESPIGLAFDDAGNLYVSECPVVEDEGRSDYGCAIRKIGVDGNVSTLGENAYNGVRHPKRNHEFALLTMDKPSGIAVDAIGRVYYINDGNVSRLTVTSPDSSPSDELMRFAFDNQATGCQGFTSIAVDKQNHIFGSNQSGGCIVELPDPDSKLRILAGGPDNSRLPADFDNMSMTLQPLKVKTDPSGNLFVEFEGNRTIRKVTLDGYISGRLNRVVDDGSAKRVSGVPGAPIDLISQRMFRASDLSRAFGIDVANFGAPPDGSYSINPRNGAFAVDAQQYLYLVAFCNRRNCVVKVSPDGQATIVKGMFSNPTDVEVDAQGNVYVYDSGPPGNSLADGTVPGERVDNVFKVANDGTSVRVAEVRMKPLKRSGVSITNRETAFLVSGSQEIYVSDLTSIRRIAPDGAVVFLAGSSTEAGYVDGNASIARFNQINGLARSRAGSIFVSDAGNDALREISADGTVTTLANGKGEGRLQYNVGILNPEIRGIAILADGQLVTASPNAVLRTE
jgi:hypothetical protein